MRMMVTVPGTERQTGERGSGVESSCEETATGGASTNSPPKTAAMHFYCPSCGVKLKAKPLPEVKPTPTKTPGSLRTYERVDVAAGVAEALGAKHSNILDAGTQAVVSPANSNGDMNGGIDLVYLKKGPKIEAKVKGEIKDDKFVLKSLVLLEEEDQE